MTSSPIYHTAIPPALILPRLLRKARAYAIAGPLGSPLTPSPTAAHGGQQDGRPIDGSEVTRS
jgi:hypothetical protein